MITQQEAFDKVLTHMREQGRPAGDGGACWYRAPDGGKCAIGCLISDENYDAELEGRGIHVIEQNHPMLKEIANFDVEFLSQLQHSHDLASQAGSQAFGEEFEAYMRLTAQRFGLQYTEVKA